MINNCIITTQGKNSDCFAFFIFFLVTGIIFLPASAYCVSANSDGTIIPDLETYPFYHFSEQRKPSSPDHYELVFHTSSSSTRSFLEDLFNHWSLPVETISQTPVTLKTDWMLWHYDKDSNKTKSKPENYFFRLNTRDRYRFQIQIESLEEQKTLISIGPYWREQEVDITEGSEMVWLKWKETPPSPQAVNAFILRLQTEFENYQRSSGQTLAHQQITDTEIHKTNNAQPDENFVMIPQPVASTWPQLIRNLASMNIQMKSVDNQQHMIKTDWIHASFDTVKHRLMINSQHPDQYRFQLIVTPGKMPDESIIFAYLLDKKLKNPLHHTPNTQQADSTIPATFLKIIYPETH